MPNPAGKLRCLTLDNMLSTAFYGTIRESWSRENKMLVHKPAPEKQHDPALQVDVRVGLKTGDRRILNRPIGVTDDMRVRTLFLFQDILPDRKCNDRAQGSIGR